MGDDRQRARGTRMKTTLSMPHSGIVLRACLALGAVGAMVVVGATVVLVSTNPRPLAYPAVAIAAVGSFLFWRAGVQAVFVVLLFEGFVRNYVDSPTVLLVKDAMLAAIYIRVFGEKVVSGRRLFDRHPANVAIAGFTAIVLAEMLNPNIVTVGQALIGARTWVFYVPLLYVAGEMVRSTRDAWRLTATLMFACVPLCILAVIQYAAGPVAYRSLGTGFVGAVFVTGIGADPFAFFRPNATFAWSAHFATFLAVCTLMCMGLVLATEGVARRSVMIGLGLLAAMTLLEGQRTYFLLLPAIGIVVLRGDFGLRNGVALLLIGAMGVIALDLLVSQLGLTSILVRPLSLLGPERDTIGVHMSTYLGSLWFTITTTPLGLGSGATALGARYGIGYIPLFVEFSPAKVVGDLGILGLVAYLWMLTQLILTTVNVRRGAWRLGDRSLYAYSSAVLGVQLLVLFIGYDIAVAALLFWFLSGSLTWAHHPTPERGRRSASASVEAASRARDAR